MEPLEPPLDPPLYSVHIGSWLSLHRYMQRRALGLSWHIGVGT